MDAQHRCLSVGGFCSVRDGRVAGTISESNGHAYKICGTWFHEDELLKESSVMEVQDLAPILCEAHGVQVRADRPCMFLRGILTQDECRELVGFGEAKHDQAGEPGMGVRSEFKHADADLSAKLWQRLAPHLPSNLDGGVAVGLRATWHHAKYFKGQWVFAHMDQRQTSEEHDDEPAIASRITLNIYLDDEYEGSEFVFVKTIRMDGTWSDEILRPKPKAGDAVLFYQGVMEFAHAIPELTAGTKHILRSDVLYRFANEEEADVGGARGIEGGAPLVSAS